MWIDVALFGLTAVGVVGCFFVVDCAIKTWCRVTGSDPIKSSNDKLFIKNKIIGNQALYKIMHPNLCQRSYQYVVGVNILKEPFNADPEVSCGPGGFYFTTAAHIHSWTAFGRYIVEVMVPWDDPTLEIVYDHKHCKFRSNRLIITNLRYSFQDTLPVTVSRPGRPGRPGRYEILASVMSACQYDDLDHLQALVVDYNLCYSVVLGHLSPKHRPKVKVLLRKVFQRLGRSLS